MTPSEPSVEPGPKTGGENEHPSGDASAAHVTAKASTSKKS